MTPVIQTKLHDPENGIRGNCFRACLASILEIPIDDIPCFEDMMSVEEPEIWVTAFANWLTPLKMDAYEVEVGKGETPRGYTIATGPSPRYPDVLHSVVALDGKPFFDPHPSGAMVTEVLYHLELVPWKTHGH